MTAQDTARAILMAWGALGLGWAVYHVVGVARQTRRNRIARRARAMFEDVGKRDESTPTQ